ncbi:hypothetical protein [Limosilactobacillus fermentum]|uniref:hypothetical protein n=1 Tax=Limosilactobacillus fermentum TaxID=1613 RepID=UPI001E3A9FE2|nr:hypothetical protein [Limosilactobacillus fermentum]MCD5423878.1 hypothetical protein [Limosilactobacillus fermentum]
MNFNWMNDEDNEMQKNQEALRQATEKLAYKQQLDIDSKKAVVDSLEVLKKIEMNTSYLKDIVELLDTSNENQKEINEMVQSILAIAKAPDKKEAETRYRSVMKKIGDFATITSSAINVAKLSSLAATVLQFFIQSH